MTILIDMISEIIENFSFWGSYEIGTWLRQIDINILTRVRFWRVATSSIGMQIIL